MSLRQNRKPVIAAFAAAIFHFASSNAAAQAGSGAEGAGFGISWISAMGIALIGVGIAFFFWRQMQTRQAAGGREADRQTADSFMKGDVYEMDGLDVDKELEWLRKARKSAVKATPKPLPRITIPQRQQSEASLLPSESDTKAFQERMRKLRYTQLPINSFVSVKPARVYEPLPLSEDPALLNAIEQASEEFEEDEAVRDLAIRVLAAFRNRNSVDSLAQIALYDLSANLRSKAVTTLTDFDHPSVFEPILLACADPTREVKAAAARGLFRLSFDRADAWKRLMETGDPFRMRHAAHAAAESGIAAKSFDRLVHDDLKIAYEAFTLVSFLICAGETEDIFKAIGSHKDERVKYALIHVLGVSGDELALTKLAEIAETKTLPEDVRRRVQETVEKSAQVSA
jgi:hypothetical protein